MAKIIIQDVIARKKKIRPTKPVKKAAKIVKEAIRPIKFGAIKSGHKPIKGKVIFGILVFLLLIILGTKALSAFSKAIIQITLHQEKVNIDTILNDVPFETMEIQLVGQKEATATGIETVETKASGQIVVYNAYSSQNQTLIAPTRFETPDGKIYRIKERIVVPGFGSVETTVYADKPGEEYNIGLTDFSVPGFKGGPRYEKFYARSKTPMTGGFKGEVPVVSDQDSQKIQQELETSIRNKLIEKAYLQIPEDFMLYEEAITVTFTKDDVDDIVIDSENPEFILRETGNLFAFLLPKQELSHALIRKYLGEDFVDTVILNNLEELNFQLINWYEEKEKLIFKLKGEARFVWQLDEEQLKEALIASPDNLEGVFETYSAIDQASIIFKPPWWRFFPEKTSKIQISYPSS